MRRLERTTDIDECMHRLRTLSGEFEDTHQPTLLIGLGGVGSRIADMVYGMTENKYPVIAYSIDTDKRDFERLKFISEKNCIDIFSWRRVKELLAIVPGAREWFPMHPALLSSIALEYTGEIRAIGRLEYETAIARDLFEELFVSINKMAQKCVETGSVFRVSIMTSLCGGTGSGIFIQVALMIRKYLADNFSALDVEIYGEFVLPSYFDMVPSLTEKVNLEIKTYAALKEINAINEAVSGNGPAVELKYCKNHQQRFVDIRPYDYCFLYEKGAYAKQLFDGEIESFVAERLFGELSITTNKGKSIYNLINPEVHKLNEVELRDVEQFKYETGKYYGSYKCVIGKGDRIVTSHLDVRWGEMLKDIQ